MKETTFQLSLQYVNRLCNYFCPQFMHSAVLFSKMGETIVERKKGMDMMTFSLQPYYLTLTFVIQKCINLNCKALV